MKKIYITSIITAFILHSSILRAQFSGCYAQANWIIHSLNTNGFVYMTTNYMDIVADTDLNGNNVQGVDCDTTHTGNVIVCNTITANGTIQFNWTWTGGNNATLLTEPFGYCLNNMVTDLTANTYYSGTAMVNVILGDNFCFVLSSQFANSHPTLFTHVNINNFSGPCNPTGVLEITAEEKIVVTTPFSNVLTVKKTAADGMLVILDSAGKEILRQQADDGETNITTKQLTKGVYVIQYTLNGQSSYIRSIKL